MQTVDISQLREDTSSVISAAQHSDVFVIEGGRVVAVVSKPRTTVVSKPSPPADFEAYWQEREKLLADVVCRGDWDSTKAISEDRDRA